MQPIVHSNGKPDCWNEPRWLTVKCDAIVHSADKNVFEIQGSSVLCLSENRFVTAEGKHIPSGQSGPTNRHFAQNFTANYAKLAQKDLVFADAQNIFDMAMCAALIQHEGFRGKRARALLATARISTPRIDGENLVTNVRRMRAQQFEKSESAG